MLVTFGVSVALCDAITSASQHAANSTRAAPQTSEGLPVEYERYGIRLLHACNVSLSEAEVGALLVWVVCFCSGDLYQWLLMGVLC